MKRLLTFFSGSLRTKLLACFLLLSLLPLCTIGYLAYSRSRDALISRTAELLEQQAKNTLDKIDRNLFERYGDVQAFAFSPAARGTPEQMTGAANFYMKSYGFYDLMLITDAEGKVLAANTVTHDGKPIDTRSLLGRSVRGEPWFEQIKAGKVGTGESFIGDVSEDKWVAEIYHNRGLSLNFSAPIFDEQGKIVGAWSNRASFDRAVSPILNAERDSHTKAGESWETQVVSRTGLILDDYDPKAVLTINLAEKGLQAAKLIAEGKSGNVTEMHKRRNVMQINGYAASSGFGSYPGHGWGVLVRQDLAEAFASASELRSFIIMTGLVAAVVVAGVAFWLAFGIVNPLRQAAKALQGVATGDLTRQVAVCTRDEVGQLSMAINDTVAGIRTALQLDKVDWQQVGQQRHEMVRVWAMVENAPINIMFADREMKIQ